MDLRTMGKKLKTVRKAARASGLKARKAISWSSVRPKLPTVKTRTQRLAAKRVAKLFRQVKRKTGI